MLRRFYRRAAPLARFGFNVALAYLAAMIVVSLLVAATRDDWMAVAKTIVILGSPFLAWVVVVVLHHVAGRRILDWVMRGARDDQVENLLAALAASPLIGPKLVEDYRREHGL